MVGRISKRHRNFAGTWVLATTAATACGWLAGSRPNAAPPPGQARLPQPSNPCVSAPLKTAKIPNSAARDFRQAKRAFDRGLRRQEEGRHAEALEEFQRAVTADPTFGLAHLEAAVSHMYTDNAENKMLRHLSAAVVLLPKNPRAHLRYGQFQKEHGAMDLAERHLDCALDLAPELADAHEAMARLFLQQDRTAEAERRARSAVALAPTETTYRVLLADILSRRDRFKEAGVEVEQAARQVGRSAALFRKAAALYAQGGADDEAQRMRAAADKLDPPPTPRKYRPLRRRR